MIILTITFYKIILEDDDNREAWCYKILYDNGTWIDSGVYDNIILALQDFKRRFTFD